MSSLCLFVNYCLGVNNGTTFIQMICYYFTDDDVTIYNNTLMCIGYSYDSVKRRLLRNANNVTSWLEANHIKVNTDKCYYTQERAHARMHARTDENQL